MKIQLTQQILVSNKSNKFTKLDELCFLSKNLYNVALYNIRQYYKKQVNICHITNLLRYCLIQII